MIKKVNKNKFGVIEYLIEDMEDLKNLPKKDTDNATYAIMRKGNEKLIYLYSSSTKEWVLINEDLSSIKSSLDNIENEIEELKQSGGGGDDIDVDLSSYAKKSDLEVKADKSYVDSAIESVDVSSQLTNYATKTELGNKVDKIDGKGLSTNDYTTAEKNKLSGLTNYTHPTSHSATMITEDSTHRFVTDSEKSSWNNKSNLALGTTSTTAFRGDYGNTAYTHSQSTHAPSNAQKNSDITKAEIEAKLTGDIATHTHSQYATKTEISNISSTISLQQDDIDEIRQMCEALGGSVFGEVDGNNNIIINATLEDGTYTVNYEDSNGKLTPIGIFKIGGSYTNRFKSSEAIYNMRMSSSGTDKSCDGCFISNYIQINSNSKTIRLTGANVIIFTIAEQEELQKYCSIEIHDASKKKLFYKSLHTNGTSPSQAIPVSVSNGIFSFEIPTTEIPTPENMAYIRICMYHTSGNATAENTKDVIVTVDEEI